MQKTKTYVSDTVSRLQPSGIRRFFDLAASMEGVISCLLYTSPSPRDAHESRMPSSA